MTGESTAPNASIGRGLIIAGALLGAAAVLRVLSPDHLSPELARRMMGVLMGVVAVVYANAVPKALSPLLQLRDPAKEQAMRRFTGWCLVLGGTAYAVAWLIAPLESANVIAATLLGVSLLLVVMRFVWATTRGARA